MANRNLLVSLVGYHLPVQQIVDRVICHSTLVRGISWPGICDAVTIIRIAPPSDGVGHVSMQE